MLTLGNEAGTGQGYRTGGAWQQGRGLFICDHANQANGATVIGGAGVADGNDFFYLIFHEKLVDHFIQGLEFLAGLKNF